MDSKTKLWRATIRVDSKTHALGSFVAEIAAAKSYDKAFRESQPCRSFLLHSLNFPDPADYFQESTWQSDPVPEGRSSRFIGVVWNQELQKYQACCKRIHLGCFPSEVDAARAFDRASLAKGGPTNFHPSTYSSGDGPSSDLSSTKLKVSNESSEVPSWLTTTLSEQDNQRRERLMSISKQLHLPATQEEPLQAETWKVLYELLVQNADAFSKRADTASQLRFDDNEPVHILTWSDAVLRKSSTPHMNSVVTARNVLDMLLGKSMLPTKNVNEPFLPTMSERHGQCIEVTTPPFTIEELTKNLDEVIGCFHRPDGLPCLN